MAVTYKILILGASYGSLLGTKMALAGHTVNLVCLPTEAELINREGAIVRLPVKGRSGLVEINSKKLPGKMSAGGTTAFNPADFDLVALAMQEPQYRSPGVRELLDAVAKAKVPCMSIMNIPPLPYLARIPGLDPAACRHCYTDPGVWDNFDPKLMTLCSPDPQAFRPPEEKVNVLQVRLPTNFKSARFDSDAHTAILRRLETDIEAVRFDSGDGKIELPVKLKVHDSIFVPLAKWSMLLAGNYRCVQKDGMIPIKEAVHSDIEASRSVYNWVVKLCVSMGADEKDLVPFEKYAAAAMSLASPSSAARALAAGAPNIERTDRLVQTIAAQKGMHSEVVDRTVMLVDGWIDANRRKAAAAKAISATASAQAGTPAGGVRAGTQRLRGGWCRRSFCALRSSGIAQAQQLHLLPRDQRVVPRRIQRPAQVPAALLLRDPARGVQAAQVERRRVAAQRLLVALVAVLVEIGHREFAQAAVYRVAPAQYGVIGLGNRPPAALAAEDRNHVVAVALRLEVHQQRRFSVHPQRGGRNNCALDAQGAALAQGFAHRQAGFAADLEILRNGVDVGLDLLGAVEAPEDCKLCFRQAQVFAAGAASPVHPVRLARLALAAGLVVFFFAAFFFTTFLFAVFFSAGSCRATLLSARACPAACFFAFARRAAA